MQPKLIKPNNNSNSNNPLNFKPQKNKKKFN